MEKDHLILKLYSGSSILKHIKSNTTLDTDQFVLRANRSPEDPISTALYSIFMNSENNEFYTRMVLYWS